MSWTLCCQLLKNKILCSILKHKPRVLKVKRDSYLLTKLRNPAVFLLESLELLHNCPLLDTKLRILAVEDLVHHGILVRFLAEEIVDGFF